MDSIAIFNQKGGVGKTTSVVNFAACLEKEFDKKILVVDCDSQCNATAYLTTFTDTEEDAERTDMGIEDYLKNDVPLNEILNRVLVPYRRNMYASNIYVVRGTRQMDIIDDIDENAFKRLIREAEELKFDYVFFDCPANLTAPTLATLSAVQFILIPITADIYSLSGYDMLIDNVQAIRSTTNIDLQVLGIFFNDLKSYRSLDKYMYVNNLENLDEIMFKSMLRTSADVPRAGFEGIPLPYYRPKSAVTQDYITLLKEIRRRINKIKRGDR